MRTRPASVVNLAEWHQFGSCGAAGTDVFFGADGETPPRRRRRIREAKQLCGRCPVLSACRDQAFAGREEYGIWGGLTARERRKMKLSLGQQN